MWEKNLSYSEFRQSFDSGNSVFLYIRLIILILLQKNILRLLDDANHVSLQQLFTQKNNFFVFFMQSHLSGHLLYLH